MKKLNRKKKMENDLFLYATYENGKKLKSTNTSCGCKPGNNGPVVVGPYYGTFH